MVAVGPEHLVACVRADATAAERATVAAPLAEPAGNGTARATDVVLEARGIVGEPLRQTQPDLSSKDIEARIAASLERVGLRARIAADYPHELSGGQRQRVALARALTTDPDVILLDEPVSALDVSIRAQVLNLFREIQDRTHVSYLFIAHDLASVKYLSTRVAVMYLGQIVETAASDELYAHPLHPYTQALLSNALPAHPDDARDEVIVQGEMPSAFNPPAGCRFHPRCPHAMPVCAKILPALTERAPGHPVACHLYDDGPRARARDGGSAGHVSPLPPAPRQR